MNIIICGAGRVGFTIAKQLSEQGHSITVIDQSSEDIQKIDDSLDVKAIVGKATYPSILEKANASDADMIIAATYSDEVNMVTCQVAHSVFKIPRKIARLRGQSYLDAIYSDLYQRDHLPIDVVISPEKEVAIQALRQLRSPATFDTEPFMEGKVELLGLTLTQECNVLNTSLRQLSELFPNLRANVVAIRRNGILIVPDSQEQLIIDDQVYVCTNADDKERCLEIFGKTNKKQDRVIIIGGGNVGLMVAKSLENNAVKIHSKIIEANRDCAERIADQLERTIVLHGDGLDMELLEEANISKTDTVLAVTDDDKTNLLACARAKSLGCPMVVALINDPTLTTLMGPLNIDASVNPRATTVSSILRHVRHGRVRAVYSIGDAEAEVIEAQVMSTSPIVGSVIRDVEWPDGSIIGAIQKNGKVFRPEGNTKIEEGDIVVIFTLSQDVSEVERLFQVNIDFF